MTLADPSRIGEVVGVQSCQQLCFISEIATTPPETHTRLVPSRRQDGAFTLWAVNGEEAERFVMSVVETHRHHNVSHSKVCGARERLLNPELFEFHLATFFCLLLPFTAFLVLFLVGDSCSTVLEFNLSSETPTFSEVVPHVDDRMRNVKTPMTGIVFVKFGLTISAHVVAIEIAPVGNLSISAHTQPIASCVVHYTVGGTLLCVGGCCT